MDPIFELDIDLTDAKGGTLVETLCRKLIDAIVDGRLQSGFKMPASRKMATALGVSRNTVLDTYDHLVSHGYINTKQGDGTYVSNDIKINQPKRSNPESEYNHRITAFWRDKKAALDFPAQPNARYTFRVGTPDLANFPYHTWRRHLAKSLRDIEKNLDFGGGPQGVESLRNAITKHVSVSRAIACAASDILITAGAQQALDILARILITPGQTKVAIETPGYVMAENAFLAAGAIIIPVRTDRLGMVIEDIPQDVSLIYVTPSHQFPFGVPMTVKRRAALLDFAERNAISVIEDDYDSDFRLAGSPLDALKTQDRQNSVFYVGTFSKNLLPDLKTGFVIAPSWAMDSMVAAKFQMDWSNPVIQQRALASFMQSGELFKHIRKMRRIYAQRYLALKNALEQHCHSYLELIPVHSGLHATALIKCRLSASVISSSALQEGVSIRSIESLCKTNHDTNGLIFGFGYIEPLDIEQAVIILARVIKRLSASHNL